MAINNGIAGALSATTCSIYRLDPTGTIPIEPLADVVPGYGPNRVTFDAVSSEQHVETFRVTQNTMQDLTDATTHVRPELRRLTIVGVFAAGGIHGSQIPGLPTSGLVRLGRFDLIRFGNLQTIARERRPVLVATPRFTLARAFIEALPASWTPADGDSMPITISFVQARVPRAGSIASFADVDAMACGNNSAGGGGSSSGGTSAVSESVSPALQGVSPMVPI